MRVLAALLAASLLVMPACASGQTAAKPAAVPATPVAVRNILFAQPFTVAVPFTTSSSDRAKVTSGTLVVVEVDPAMIDTRDAAMPPVLYADNAVVVKLTQGASGRVIGIIPGTVDLATTPIWFGAPELPGRVTAATIRTERARADQAGLHAFAPQKLAGVTRPAIAKPDLLALLRDVAAELVDQYSPQDKALADAWRRPVATAPKRR